MIFNKAALLIAGGFAYNVAAHGYIKSCSVNGQVYKGYNPRNPPLATEPAVGWYIPLDTENTFINFKDVNSPDIICHFGATPAPASITVKPGDTIKCQWSAWPVGHHGDVFNYLANCNGDCAKADKTTLKFNKITETCLIHPYPGVPIGADLRMGDPKSNRCGYWGGDELIDRGDVFEFTVPSTIAKGGYVLRQEKIALQEAMPQARGPQPVPQCINLLVEESTGQDAFTTGTLGVELYNKDDPGFHLDIFHNVGQYTCPGPPLYKAGGSTSPTPVTPNPKPVTPNPKPVNPHAKPATYHAKPAMHHSEPAIHHSEPAMHHSEPSTYHSKPATHPGAKSNGPKQSYVEPIDGSTAHHQPHHDDKPAHPKPVTYHSAQQYSAPPAKDSSTEFPAEFNTITNLNAKDFFNWLEKFIHAFEAKYRNHARDVVGA